MIFTRYYKFPIDSTHKRRDIDKPSKIIDKINHFIPTKWCDDYGFLIYIINKVIYIKLI